MSMESASNTRGVVREKAPRFLDERERKRLAARRRAGKIFAAVTLIPVVVALGLIAVLFFDVITDTFSWQIVEPENSGQSFAWYRAPLGGERVVRLELEAQLAQGQLDREEVRATLNDPEERRLFGVRNRVELMLFTAQGPFRWVVTSSRDDREADIGLFGVNGYLRGVREDLAEEDAEDLEPQEQRLLERLRAANLERGFAHIDLLRASLEEGQVLYLNPWLDFSFFAKDASRTPIVAGLKTALVGSLYVIALVILVAIPIGVGAAVYLEEYAPNNRLTRFLEVNIRNLAGVPSIVYGILGLSVFVRFASFGPSILSAALTLALLSLPVIVIAGREAIRAVPGSLRQASYGLGATKWQTVSQVVLPNAVSGIVTGVILSTARAIGETAPLLLVGAAAFVPFLPDGLLSQYTVMPVQIYSWISENDPEFYHVASAAILVLLIVLLMLYGLAFYLRRRFERNW